MTTTTDIKSAVSLIDLVAKKYQIVGERRYRKTKEHDSLVVDTHEERYYWNSHNGESGDLIDWVGRYELNYNGQWDSRDPALFKESLAWLANYAGLPAPQFKPEDAQARARRLDRERLMGLVAGYYQANLDKEIQAYQYALERGFNMETIEQYLGYADGNLWRHLAEADRPTAAGLGLIKATGKKWRDAIYKGNLVYIHRNKGRVEYLSGRYIAEKRHCNIQAPKQMYWATKPGFKRLVICEGQADALSVAQLGVSGLGLCGINLSDFDPDLLRLYDQIYIWQDSDPAGSEAARSWYPRLAEIADALGPAIRIIDAPAKDPNDFLRDGGTAGDLAKLLRHAETFLNIEISRLANLYGADRYDQLEPLFRRLADLNVFQLNIYRSSVCKRLDISQGDFGRFLKAAKGQLSDDEEAEFAKGGQYDIIDGHTVLKTITADGRRRITALANGSARILEEISKDNGSNDPQLDFVIGGELATGQKLKKITIPAVEFDQMKWTAQWGARFILSAGGSIKDHFRAAVQHLSGGPYRRTIYEHTGWRKIGDEWVYLTRNGALGSADTNIQVDLQCGRSETNMNRYKLPLQPEEITEAVRASLDSWHITDLTETIPIWAAVHLAPLSPFITADFGLWVHGQSGSMKSSIAAVMLAHFGQWQGDKARLFLPSSFRSTTNNIMMDAFLAKDALLVIDDFAPGATQREVRERDNTASNLLRSVGNRAARGRMRDGRRFQADFPPRCLALITAEDLPKTQSIMARGIGVGVKTPREGDPARRPIEQKLLTAQETDSYRYPHAMAAYILWIRRHWEALKRDLPVIAQRYRDAMQLAGHARLPDAFGKLMAAVDTALYFALDAGAITGSEARDRKSAAFDALTQMIAAHSDAVDSVDATTLFKEILIERLDSKHWYLCPVDAGSTRPPENYPAKAEVVGYIDDHLIYLNAKTVSDVMEIYQRLGTPFPVGRNTLYKRLIERGWLIPGSQKTTTIINPPVLDRKSTRVLRLVKKEFED